MAALSLREVPALKEALREYGYELHLHDACGGQSFSLEPSEHTAQDPEGVRLAAERFFAERSMNISFYGKQPSGFTVL